MSGHWGFYGRHEELGGLVRALRADRWFFGAIRGRRRVGKTELAHRALDTVRAEDPGRPILYLQLVDESESGMATRFRRAIAAEPSLDPATIDLDDLRDHHGVANAVGRICAAHGIVVLDEFQVCHRGPLRPLASSLQFEVDNLQRRDRRGALILLGSVQTEMEELLHGQRSPLFGRATYSLTLRPWRIATTLNVAGRHGGADPHRFLTLWTLFDGVPKYWRHFAGLTGSLPGQGNDRWTMDLANRLFLAPDALLRDEGEVLLGRELQGDSLRILREVATRRFSTLPRLRRVFPGLADLEERLEALVLDLRLVGQRMPMFRGNRQAARYVVSDPFLRAWLNVFESAAGRAQVRQAHGIDKALLRDLRTLEGYAFEEIVREASHQASRLGADDFPLTELAGGYWNRPEAGGDIEIDYIAWNADEVRVRFGSCKRNAHAHDEASLNRFRGHVDRYLNTDHGRRFRDAHTEYALFSPVFELDQRSALEGGGWICRDLSDFRRMLSPPFTPTSRPR